MQLIPAIQNSTMFFLSQLYIQQFYSLLLFFFHLQSATCPWDATKKYPLVVRPHEGLPLPLWVNCWVTEETQSAGATYTLPDIKLNIDQVRKIRSEVSLWCPSRAVSALNESLDTHAHTHNATISYIDLQVVETGIASGWPPSNDTF